VTSPQRGEARWGVVPQAAVRGGGHRLRVPPSNLPPLGGGKKSFYTAVDHNEEGGLFKKSSKLEPALSASRRWHLTFPWHSYPIPSYGVCPAPELMVTHLKNLDETLDHWTRLWYHRCVATIVFWRV